MDRKSFEEWLAEFDRKSIEEYKKRDPNATNYSSEQAHSLLVELKRRCEAIGRADPLIAQELIGKIEQL
jgi:hypothetical protein